MCNEKLCSYLCLQKEEKITNYVENLLHLKNEFITQQEIQILHMS